MTIEADPGQAAPNRVRTVVLAFLALLICAMGTAWGYQSFFAGKYGEEQQAVYALKQLAMVHVKYDDKGSVIELHATSPQITDEAAPHLMKLHSLQRLNLNRSGITDKSLVILAALPQLKSLYLEQTAVTTIGVTELASAKQLEELMLRECPIDDQALEAIGSLDNLILLDVSKTKITDAGMANLQSLTNLETLYLKSTEVTGQGFASLAPLSKLELIDFSHSNVDREVIKTLGAFPELDRLNLGYSAIDDQMIPELMETLISRNSKLRGLLLARIQLTDAAVESLKRLAELPELVVVELQDTKITKAAFLELAKSTPEINYAVDYPAGD